MKRVNCSGVRSHLTSSAPFLLMPTLHIFFVVVVVSSFICICISFDFFGMCGMCGMCAVVSDDGNFL